MSSAASEWKSLLEGRLVVATGVGIGRSKSLRKSASAERKRITSRNNALANWAGAGWEGRCRKSVKGKARKKTRAYEVMQSLPARATSAAPIS